MESKKPQNKRKHQSTQGIDGVKWLQDARNFSLAENPEIHLHTDQQTLAEEVDAILAVLRERGIISD